MLNATPGDRADIDLQDGPYLSVVVDTEEEFDWSRPFDRSAVSVSSIRRQEQAHRIFEQYGLKPTYVVDYPVASQDDGFLPLRDLLRSGLCDIGCHLHPWVNPPHDEIVNPYNSYPGNLPPQLERQKLTVLRDKVAENFDIVPKIYKAGRYGVGPNTASLLQTLDFEIDTSVVPATEFMADGGPDFRGLPNLPYWFGEQPRLLEIPVTTGLVGRASACGQTLYDATEKPLARRLRLRGIMARTRLLERIRLTPEGIDFAALRRLTRAMLARNERIFTLTYHSPTLGIGHTPYVRSRNDLDVFLDRLRRYCDYFFGELGGRAATLREIRSLAPGDPSHFELGGPAAAAPPSKFFT